jgi:hypothetical protein
MKRVYGNKNNTFDLIFTIDELLEEIYSEWFRNPETMIKQYVSISKALDDLVNKEKQIYRVFKSNQHEVLDAMRFLAELDFFSDNINEEELTKEQKLFLKILKKTRKEDIWEKGLKINLSPKIIKKSIGEIIKNKIHNLEKQKEKVSFLKEEKIQMQINKFKILIKDYKSKEINKLVIHGVHHFTPLLKRFIKDLNDVEIIFLFNYNQNYPEIFNTWKHVYSWTEINEEDFLIHDSEINHPGKVGKQIGEVTNGKRNIGSLNVDYIKYDNFTSFTDYVANTFEDADEEMKKMREQFYAPNSQKANDLLQNYFPEQFGEKHFLAYPIGQFIMALYNMWDSEEGTLVIDDVNIKECLNVNFFFDQRTVTPIEIYEKIKLYFEDVDIFNKYCERLVELIKRKENIEKYNDPRLDGLEKLAFYNIEINDLEYFKDVLLSLKKIAEEIFSTNKKNTINYKKHFQKLMKIIHEKTYNAENIKKEEKELVEEIKQKLDNIKNLNIEGSIEDIKETLHLFLSQKNNEDKANWIVRDFEQLDGGILLSNIWNQSDKVNEKKYHIAMLSNEMMKKNLEDILPWPLDNLFFNNYSGILDDIDAVLTSFKEYNNFLRYSLFYATYYLKDKEDTKIKLSYVENEDNEVNTPYYLLNLLGIEAQRFTEKDLKSKDFNTGIQRNSSSPSSVYNIKYRSKEEVQDFNICEYRYLLSDILDRKSYFNNSYHNHLYYIVLLTRNSWYELEGKESSLICEVVEKENIFLANYFLFLKDIDLFDNKEKVKEFFHEKIDKDTGKIKRIDERYMDIRLNLLYAQISRSNNDLEENKEESKNLIEHVFKINNSNLDENSKNILEYLESPNLIKEEKVDYEVCKYCEQKDLCLNHIAGDESYD